MWITIGIIAGFVVGVIGIYVYVAFKTMVNL
jgi:hypothetical protein